MGSAKQESRHYSHLDRDGVLRAIAGALFGALPLLYTMEMWWYGRTVSDGFLVALFLPTVGIVSLCLLFGGFRMGRHERLWLDTFITLGIGIAVSAITLFIVGQIAPGIVPVSVALRMVAVEAIPCSIGAALAVTQFRPRTPTEDHVDRRMRQLPQDVQKVLATIVGAVFFGFNIAPTEEPWKMMIEAEAYHFPLIVLFSLAVSYMIVFLAEFAERGGGGRTGVLGNPTTETLVSYLLSLGVALGFLVAFGHVDGETPPYYVIAATVMLSYVTTIGGSAGRVLVVE